MQTYQTKGVCSSQIQFEIQDGLIKEVQFTGGCNGNLKGIGNLVVGMTPKAAAERLKDIKCGARDSSCPDQLSMALTDWLRVSA